MSLGGTLSSDFFCNRLGKPPSTGTSVAKRTESATAKATNRLTQTRNDWPHEKVEVERTRWIYDPKQGLIEKQQIVVRAEGPDACVALLKTELTFKAPAAAGSRNYGFATLLDQCRSQDALRNVTPVEQRPRKPRRPYVWPAGEPVAGAAPAQSSPAKTPVETLTASLSRTETKLAAPAGDGKLRLEKLRGGVGLQGNIGVFGGHLYVEGTFRRRK